MRELLRKHPRFFLAATVAAIVLRFIFLIGFPAVTSDSFVYGDIAKSWLQHGIYGLGGGTEITPTDIRLPGYPAFLAFVFAVFGIDHYRAVLVMQLFVDLGTCFLIADLTRRLVTDRAAKMAFLLAALCPFLANYAGAALTETWEIFFTALALDLAVVGLQERRTLWTWVFCGLAVGGAILLRPDGGLLLISIVAFLLIFGLKALPIEKQRSPSPMKAAVIVSTVSLFCLMPWTVRNLRTFHEFQPLAPRYANQKDAFVPVGFIRWVKTWIADYASVEEVYWAVPGGAINVDNLPSRAFDSAAERDQTSQFVEDYNRALHIDPALDARFNASAEARIHHNPLRYYLFLPVLRIADMWLRPRTEILPCNTRWWEFDEDPQWLALSIAVGITNLLYVGLALLGIFRGQFKIGFGMLLLFVVLRSAFLGTIENPEPRYTMECYPIVIVFAAAALSCNKQSPSNPRSYTQN